jgi:hypothetical protein
LLSGPISPAQAAKALDTTKRELALRRAAPDLYATVPHSPLSQSEPITAPLDVQGEVGSAHFHYLLGDGGATSFEQHIAHAPPGAKLRLVVTPVAPTRLLTPHGAATWAAALGRRHVDRSHLLEQVSRVRLTLARELQYQSFLANPDPNARSSAVYIYESATPRVTAAPRAPAHAGGRNGVWRAVLFAVVAVGGLGGVLVLWANS